LVDLQRPADRRPALTSVVWLEREPAERSNEPDTRIHRRHDPCSNYTDRLSVIHDDWFLHVNSSNIRSD